MENQIGGAKDLARLSKTTMRYIGVDVHHMAAALEDFNTMQLIKNKETEINE